MGLCSITILQSLLCLYTLSRAAAVPAPITLNSAAINAPFNLSSFQNVNSSLSAHPRLPFHYPIYGTNIALVFTSFGSLLPDTDVFATFIDATYFAIEGMEVDGRQPTDPRHPLRWSQGAAEFSLTAWGQTPLNYNHLASIIAGVHGISMKYGIYAVRFDIWIANQLIGGGQLASRRPRIITSTTAAASNGTTHITARDLTSPPDPYRMHVSNTPITVVFSSYRGPMDPSALLDVLVAAIFTAAGAIHDTGDAQIGQSLMWKRAARFSLWPNEAMNWRDLADTVKGMKYFVLAEGGSLDFQFELLVGKVLKARRPKIGQGRVGHI